MLRLVAITAVFFTACQSPVGLVRDDGSKSLLAVVNSLRSPPPPNPTEDLARQLASDLESTPFTSGFPFPPSQIRSVYIASDYRANLLYRHHARDGAGIPLVLEAASTAPHHPQAGRFIPATAVVRDNTLHLADPLTDQSLAADFTVPFAFHAKSHAGRSESLKGLVSADKITPRFHIHDPYDPDKIPLVMIHGLGASPATWSQLTNIVLGDTSLRSRYQVWHYFYPTGVPFLEAAEEFRLGFGRFRLALASATGLAEPRHPALFVCHSLGGLMVKTLASDSGEILQQASGLDHAETSLHFTRSPHIARAIFVASPLNGSTLAAVPGAEIAYFIPSISTIASDHPVTKAFSSIPIAPDIPFHIVLGKKFTISKTAFSDGVVSYNNASVPGAQSTLVVPTNTHNVHTTPAALTEIQRILYLHLADAS
ncbi:MAG: hypothetical protein P8J87_16765 [Verrucomicrobiales bacterium]|nr:hypothetical protein [Verrucomicrobiales bacterium]